jgi:hypothetical protein
MPGDLAVAVSYFSPLPLSVSRFISGSLPPDDEKASGSVDATLD